MLAHLIHHFIGVDCSMPGGIDAYGWIYMTLASSAIHNLWRIFLDNAFVGVDIYISNSKNPEFLKRVYTPITKSISCR